MSILSKATSPKKPKTPDSVRAAYLYAGILTVFVLSQLFAFDEFLNLFAVFGIGVAVLPTNLIATLLMICELFAIPFLLGMRLNHVFRYISMFMGWAASAGWLVIVLHQNLTRVYINNVGFLGTKVKLAQGWWSVSFALALCILAAWSSWGLWPGKRKK